MRRKAGALTPKEVGLLRAAVNLHTAGESEWHGWQLAKAEQTEAGSERPTASGSLYRALDNMERLGYLASRREDPAVAEAEQRPRRRLYQVTGLGRQVLPAAEAALAEQRQPGGRLAGEGVPT